MIVRERLVSVLPSDLSDNRVLPEKSSYYHAVFSTLQDLESLKVTDTRKENLAEKRHEKRAGQVPALPSQVAPVWVGQRAPPLSAEETRRIASISDPSKSSSGGQLFHATQERESEVLGNQFCITTLKVLFLDGPALAWVTGRPKAPIIQWRHGYIIPPTFSNRSALAAEFKLGPERIGARTDGGLQIVLHRAPGELIAWDRSYYEVALEVSLTFMLTVGETLLQNKAEQRWHGKYL
jgi:hypothetical protein